MKYFVLVVALVCAPMSAFGQEPCEPQTLDPVRDLDLIRSLGFSPTFDPADDRLNVLVVGQDRRAGPLRHTDSLASRGDAIEVMSIDRRTGEATLFSFYRGNFTPADCWVGVTDQGETVVRGERYLANLYRLGQRRMFVPCIEQMMTSHLQAAGLTSFLTDGRFELDGMLETNFVSFRRIIWSAVDAIAADPIHLGWIYVGHVSQFMDASGNRVAIRNALVPSGDILRELRDRTSYSAEGYQRAYNHAKFLTTALGYIAFGERAETEHSHASHFRLLYEEHLSASHPFEEFEKALTGPDGKSLLRYAGYRDGQSTVAIYQWGSRRGQYLKVQHGVADLSHLRGHPKLGLVNTQLVIVPPPKDVAD